MHYLSLITTKRQHLHKMPPTIPWFGTKPTKSNHLRPIYVTMKAAREPASQSLGWGSWVLAYYATFTRFSSRPMISCNGPGGGQIVSSQQLTSGNGDVATRCSPLVSTGTHCNRTGGVSGAVLNSLTLTNFTGKDRRSVLPYCVIKSCKGSTVQGQGFVALK